MEEIVKERVKLPDVEIYRVRLAQEMIAKTKAELALAEERQAHLVTRLAAQYGRPGMMLVEVDGSELVFQRPELVVKAASIPPPRPSYSDQDGETMVNPAEV